MGHACRRDGTAALKVSPTHASHTECGFEAKGRRRCARQEAETTAGQRRANPPRASPVGETVCGDRRQCTSILWTLRSALRGPPFNPRQGTPMPAAPLSQEAVPAHSSDGAVTSRRSPPPLTRQQQTHKLSKPRAPRPHGKAHGLTRDRTRHRAGRKLLPTGDTGVQAPAHGGRGPRVLAEGSLCEPQHTRSATLTQHNYPQKSSH